MADAGYSADYKLCKRLGLQEKKYITHLDSDDELMVILKNHANDCIYYYLKIIENRFNNWNDLRNKIDNIIITMNQLRQRNWYWKSITLN